MHNFEPNKVPLWKDEDHWQSITFAAAAISFALLLLVAVFWIFAAGIDTDEILKRVQIVAPFAVFAGATVTFCTVIWRGLISSRQANTGLEQLNGLRKQIALTEETNLAELMQKGAELLADENDAKVAAGIASLQAVAESDENKFTEPSRRLLIDYVKNNGRKTHSDRLVEMAINAVSRAFLKHPSIVDEYISFEEDDELLARSDQYVALWRIVEGVAGVSYRYGSIRQQDIRKSSLQCSAFVGVHFQDCRIGDLSHISGRANRYSNCKFERIHTSLLDEKRFDACDFSGTVIAFDESMIDLKGKNNYYYADNPPVAENNTGPHVDWHDVFIVYEEYPDFTTSSNPW